MPPTRLLLRPLARGLKPLAPIRSYHATSHPPPPGPFTSTESSLLSSAYAHVPTHGFTQRALASGARDAGYLDISTNLLPEGVFSLIRYHLVKQRTALAGQAQALEPSLSVSQRVEALAWARLMGNEAVIARWQEALAIMAQPSHIPASLHELSLLADEIYFLAGDLSVDPSWYTKRASLSGIYAASELFMTNDHSHEYAETRAFLRRRLSDAEEVGGYVRNIGQWVGFTASSGMNLLRSKGVRI